MPMKLELPAGWVETTLGSIGEVKSGVGFPVEAQGKISGKYPVYKVSDISKAVLFAGGELLRSANYVSEEVSSSLKGHIFPNGTVLFAKIGEALRLNRRAIVHARGLADNNVMGFKAGDGLDDKFIFYFLQTRDLASLSRSTTIPSIRKGDVESVSVRLPPASEQKRIAQMLDALLAQVDTLKARIDEIPGLIQRFRESVLRNAVSGRLTEAWRSAHPEKTAALWLQGFSPLPPPPRYKSRSDAHIMGVCATSIGKPKSPLVEAWEWVPLVQIARMESGHTPSRDVPTYWNGDIPWIGIKDARANHEGTIYSTQQSTNQSGLDNSAARLLPAQTVCISRTASVGYVVKMGVPMATSQDFVNWVPTQYVDAEWLKWLFVAERESLFRFGKGSTHTTIYFPEWLSLHIALPHIDEQIEIARRVQELLALADNMVERVNDAKKRIDALTQSILSKAVRGELVPQDPNDEPASVLLERIRAQRAAAPKPKRGRKAAKN